MKIYILNKIIFEFKNVGKINYGSFLFLQVKLSWAQCLKCKGYFPEQYLKTHQEKNCISRLIFRSKLDEPRAESAPKKRRIVDTMQITQYKPILPRGGIQIGMCTVALCTIFTILLTL